MFVNVAEQTIPGVGVCHLSGDLVFTMEVSILLEIWYSQRGGSIFREIWYVTFPEIEYSQPGSTDGTKGRSITTSRVVPGIWVEGLVSIAEGLSFWCLVFSVFY